MFGVGVTLTFGDPIRVEMTKWGDRSHWAFAAYYLGADEHGDWIGLPSGTPMARPGARFVTETDQVALVPRPGAGGGAGWVATFHAPGYLMATYVDMTSVPVWDEMVCRAVDLDLDVIRGASGTVWVDDEDEFAEHQVELDYPPELIELAETSCAYVHDAVLNEHEPFGDASQPWFARLSDLRVV